MAKKTGNNFIRNTGKKVITNKNIKRTFKYDLTIGMIVKNEIKYLEECMEAIKPLRDMINLEIIITDTGSTDGTIEVAKKYADKYLEFEWVNDFAIARNTGVKESEGAWFMYLDADEIADNTIGKLAEFIKSKNRDSYDSATIEISNYKSRTGERVSSVLSGARLFNFTNGKRPFIDSIHERIAFTENRFRVEANFNHYGYINEVIDEKLARNREFLKAALEKDPHDLPALKHMIDTYKNASDRIEHCHKCIKIMKDNNIVHDFSVYFDVELVRLYAITKEPQKVFEYGEIFLEKFKNMDIVPKSEALYIMGQTYKTIEDRENIYKYFILYFESYERLQKKPDARYSSIASYEFVNEKVYTSVGLRLAKMYIEDGDYDTASKYLNKVKAHDYVSKEGNRPYTVEAITVATQCGDGELAYDAFSKTILKYNKASDDLIVKAINDGLKLLNDEERRKDYLEYFIDAPEKHDIVLLNTLRYYDYDLDQCGEEVVNKLLEKENLFASELLAEVINSTLLYDKDILGYFDKVSNNEIKKLLYHLFEDNMNMHNIYYKKVISFSDEDINNLSLERVNLFNHVAINCLVKEITRAIGVPDKKDKKGNIIKGIEADETREEVVIKIFDALIKTGNVLAEKLYTSEILENSKNYNVLPNNTAFCLSINKAFKNRNNEPAVYIDSLKESIKYYPQIKDAIKIIGNNIKQEASKQDNTNKQFEALGNQIKEMLRMFITQKNKVQAQEILEKYKTINPNDPEIESLVEKINKI